MRNRFLRDWTIEHFLVRAPDGNPWLVATLILPDGRELVLNWPHREIQGEDGRIYLEKVGKPVWYLDGRPISSDFARQLREFAKYAK